MTPTVNAVASDNKDFGIKAVQFLIERINGTYTGVPRVYLVPNFLNIRESTARLS
jgi:DNA-binding LacI/PurR family transcriptional regulator